MRSGDEKRVEPPTLVKDYIARAHSGGRMGSQAGALEMASRKAATSKRVIIGVIEDVTVRGPKGEITVPAKVDTGAERTSLDTDLAAQAGLGPVLRRVRIRAAAAEKPEERDVVRATLVLDGETFEVAAAVTDRKDMRYRIIVGMDVLARSGFLVNPRKGGERKRHRARREI